MAPLHLLFFESEHIIWTPSSSAYVCHAFCRFSSDSYRASFSLFCSCEDSNTWLDELMTQQDDSMTCNHWPLFTVGCHCVPLLVWKPIWQTLIITMIAWGLLSVIDDLRPSTQHQQQCTNDTSGYIRSLSNTKLLAFKMLSKTSQGTGRDAEIPVTRPLEVTPCLVDICRHMHMADLAKSTSVPMRNIMDDAPKNFPNNQK